MKAKLRNYRQAPRKVRLVADAVRGKTVGEALRSLAFLNKKASLPVSKLLQSAVANAKQVKNVSEDNLIVKEITVDKGITFKRGIRHAKRWFPIKKETSHISVTLGDK